MTSSEKIIIEATVPTGLEKLSAEEVAEKIVEGTVISEQGRVFIDIPVKAIDDENTLKMINKCLKLRSVDNVYCVVWQGTMNMMKVTKEDALNQVAELSRAVDWSRLLTIQQLVFGDWPGTIETSLRHFNDYVVENPKVDNSQPEIDDDTTRIERNDNDNLPSFRVTCYRTEIEYKFFSGDHHSFGSPDAAGCLGDHVQRQFGWRVKMKQMDLEVVLRITDNKVSISIPMNKETLFKRNIVAFGPTTLRATIAYGLLRIAKPEPGDIVMDPLCGSGAIPIEAYHEFKNTAIVGVERNDKGMANSSVNCSAAYEKQKRTGEFGRCCDCILGDSTRLSWRTATVDCIVTDMPFGKRMGTQAGNQVLYPRLIREFARITRPVTGRAVLMTQDKKAINRVLSRSNPHWKLVWTTFINVGGLAAHAYLLRRTEMEWEDK